MNRYDLLEACQIESLEHAAETKFDKITEGLTPGKFKCFCGNVDNLDDAMPASPDPYSDPLCGDCYEERTRSNLMKKREVIFDNKWLRVVKLDGWFVASEPAQSKDNMAVAVLPYRKTFLSPEPNPLSINGKLQPSPTRKYKNQFLARYELNPAHMTDLLHQVSIITGACETGNPLYHAKMELLEEGGYDIPEDRFKFMGIVSPMKASCTKLHLYTVRICRKDECLDAKGDGGVHEAKEYAGWVDRNTIINCKDPYAQTIILRGNL
jgi:hypothetical protein